MGDTSEDNTQGIRDNLNPGRLCTEVISVDLNMNVFARGIFHGGTLTMRPASNNLL